MKGHLVHFSRASFIATAVSLLVTVFARMVLRYPSSSTVHCTRPGIRVKTRCRRIGAVFFFLSAAILQAMTSWRVTNDINIYLKQMYQTRAKTRKYLLYFAQGGWANQQRCLKNAYAMARILDRTLLLPPVLPHGLWGYTSQRTVLTADQGHFKPKNDSSTDPLFLYLERLPAKRYMPMSQVLDINFSLPDIPTLDVRDFHQRYYHENLTTSTIEIDPLFRQ